MRIESIDHLVLTVANISRAVAFYCGVLGMEKVSFGDGRVALHFGSQKINLHQYENKIEPKAVSPCPGSADLCFVVNEDVTELVKHLDYKGVVVFEGPAKRTGATGNLLSIYLRDPDGNLIELSNEDR